MAEAAANAGLRGVTVGTTAICEVVPDGAHLRYRGYDLEDLAEHARFEEVAHLLIHGRLPDRAELAAYEERLGRLRRLPAGLGDVLERMPAAAHPMDVLRTACSALGAIEPEGDARRQLDASDRIVALLPSALGYWHRFTTRGERTTAATEQPTLAGQTLELLVGRPPAAEHVRFLDAALIAYAELELNASAFVARTIAATGADLHSAITGALGALRGPLHGGANEGAMALVERFGTPEQAVAGVRERLARKERVMGFGHAVYRRRDPRSDVFKRWARRLAAEAEDGRLYDVSEAIEQTLASDKGLFPNADFYAASAFHFVGLETRLFTPLFALGRVAGWCAHVIEQRANNRLIRPTAAYVGPGRREYVPLERR